MADSEHLYTCLSCSIAFTSAEEQREHYRSDHHRYNMKRRVAGLPPVSAIVFNQKVLDRRNETAIMSSLQGSMCEVCNKTYSTENAYRSHINSKKHKDAEFKAASRPQQTNVPAEPTQEVEPPLKPVSEDVPMKSPDGDEDEVMQSIDDKIAASRSKLSTSECLFCTTSSSSLEDNLTHMASIHSFFIPDADYLVDLAGLITYLGEKVAVGNVCLHCNEKGRDFRTLEAVRKHMVDKSHCKLAYDSERDRLELSDYYDFTTSYAMVPAKRKSKKRLPEDEEWEDVNNSDTDSDADQVVEEKDDEDSDEDEDESEVDDSLTYGDSNFELVLPSGARIGHRSLRKYYAQHFSPSSRVAKEEDPNSGAALVRRLIKDKNSALVPVKGGFGAYGTGTEVVKARNRGEAREAGRHVKEFRDQKRREDFKTKVGFRGNYQKHFRDPLLQ